VIEAPNSKHQTSEKFQIPKSKLQKKSQAPISKRYALVGEIGIWDFIGIWNLGFEI
jgi:hypothetical protein